MLLSPIAAHAATRTPRSDITITWPGEFNKAHGVRSGRGTIKDPYIISGWAVNNISIRDTDKAFKILNNTITQQLVLNWNGPDVEVRGNDIGDLRLNENNARWGHPTSGTITKNRFTTVGQLRHFDGNFTYNTVGAPNGGLAPSYPDLRAVNFDGFNGATFMHNTIYGYVDARLHGHHHSGGFTNTTHDHAAGPGSPKASAHTQRYHQVMIHGNHIYTSHAYALSYLDTNHAGNDRTADSETNPYLNAPHTHYTRVTIMKNMLMGAGIKINVFNAQDERHKGTPKGRLDILANEISLERDVAHSTDVLQGITVEQARDVQLRISKNTIEGAKPPVDVNALRPFIVRGEGIVLDGLERATVMIDGGLISDRQFGVRALGLPKSVRWTVRGVKMAGVQTPVTYDSSVANAPGR